MIRTLLLLTSTIIATAGLSASAASAVVVQNPGMHELEDETTLAIGVHAPVGFVPSLTCDREMEATVSEAGAFEFHDVTYHPDHSSQVGACNSVDDCDNAGWHDGQLEETGLDQFTLHYTYCIEGQGGQFDSVPIAMECPIADTEIHCDATIGTQQTPFGTLNVEMVGEMTFHDSLGLAHEEG